MRRGAVLLWGGLGVAACDLRLAEYRGSGNERVQTSDDAMGVRGQKKKNKKKKKKKKNKGTHENCLRV